MSALILVNLVGTLDMILIGYIMKKRPSPEYKSQNGYSTPVARRSKEHWEYAQSIAPDIFIKSGVIWTIVELIVGAMLLLGQVSLNLTIITGAVICVIALVIAFLLTDSKIKSNCEGKNAGCHK